MNCSIAGITHANLFVFIKNTSSIVGQSDKEKQAYCKGHRGLRRILQESKLEHVLGSYQFKLFSNTNNSLRSTKFYEFMKE